MSASDRFDELQQILEAIFENRLTTQQAVRLDELTLRDAAARWFYLEYINLHGNLHWDIAQGDDAQGNVAPQNASATNDTSTSLETIFNLDTVTGPESGTTEEADPHNFAGSTSPARELLRPEAGAWALRKRRSKFRPAAEFILAAVTLVCMAVWVTWAVRAPRQQQPPPNVVQNLEPAPPRERSLRSDEPQTTKDQRPIDQQAGKIALPSNPAEAAPPDRPLDHAAIAAGSDARPVVTTAPAIPVNPPVSEKPRSSSTSQSEPGPPNLIAFIDEHIRSGWKSAGVEPSPTASDGEWLRRVYLDLVGHIPPEDAVDKFLDDKNPQKRASMVHRLLGRRNFSRNWSTLWTNMLVGRRTQKAGVSREALEKFLRDSFTAKVGWNEIVYELVSAEGAADQNPAANFLLAHLNNEAVPATAMTARLFLCVQVQCTQCHDHPFHKDKQNRFWELNSFFQQTELASQTLPGTGMEGPALPTTAATALVTRKVGGPMYYETLRGEMRAAYPIYAGQKVDPGPLVNRRRELARLIAKGNDRQLALAMVNRTWQHFLGRGFTDPVDDMGPHNPPTNPEVLDRLAQDFIVSGYDLRQLIRWICATDAYQRSSTLEESNRADDPASGAPPLFSRVYLKPMTAEQLYDSLLVATRAKSSARTDWNDVGRRRPDWVRQFVIRYGTDENDETTTLAGSISQALVMMNDPIVQRALALEPGTLLYDVVHDTKDEKAKITRLCRSALSRNPTQAEIQAALETIQFHHRVAKSEKARQQAEAQALEDIFWAYLNANEFAIGH